MQGTIYAAIAWALGIENTLPAAVQEDIDELRRDAAAGDEEAIKALAEDPLTEKEDAWIRGWIVDALRRRGILAKEAPPAEEIEDDAAAAAKRPRIPFGPFLILACLELLFAS